MTFGKRGRVPHTPEAKGIERSQIVQALQSLQATFMAPCKLQPGDLVQTINPGAELNGITQQDLAFGIVLEIVGNLATVTEPPHPYTGTGIRVAMITEGGMSLTWHEAWLWERYAGAVPAHAH